MPLADMADLIEDFLAHSIWILFSECIQFFSCQHDNHPIFYSSNRRIHADNRTYFVFQMSNMILEKASFLSGQNQVFSLLFLSNFSPTCKNTCQIAPLREKSPNPLKYKGFRAIRQREMRPCLAFYGLWRFRYIPASSVIFRVFQSILKNSKSGRVKALVGSNPTASAIAQPA